MTHPSPFRRLLSAVLLAFASVTLLLALSTPANAADPAPTGKAVFTLGTGKAGKALKNQKVKIKAIAPARIKRLSRGRVRVTMEASSAVNTVRLKGGIRFVRGKRSLNMIFPSLHGGKKWVWVGANFGGYNMIPLKGKGRRTDNTAGDAANVKLNGQLSFTRAAAKRLRKKLKLRRKVPAAPFGKLNGNFSTRTAPANMDPYFSECGLSATSRMNGSLSPASPLPAMTGAKQLSGTPAIAWGFKASLRGYVGGAGSLKVTGGAGRDGNSPMAGFTFPAEDGVYKANDPVDTSDDQAVINGKGTAIFCNPGHGFRIAISNPTIVVDGANSRIVADIDTNYWGVWTPAQRIDLARLDLDGIAPFFNRSGSQVTWSDIPATLTAVGAESLCEPPSEGRPGSCNYFEGDELDAITADARTAYKTGNGSPEAMNVLATFSANELRFPFANGSSGGCSPMIPAGGNADDARTIDEYLSYNSQAPTPVTPPAYNWLPDAARPAATPDLTGSTTLTGGGLDWGVRSGLRGSVNGTGEFNLAGGVTASNTPYVGNGLGSLPYPQAGGTGKMGGTGKFFTWPSTATNTGFYDAGAAGGSDDRLILRGKGTVGFCNMMEIMSYGTVLSNPTVVIDGADSRIVLDVATRFRLSWLRGTVDFAKLDLTGISPTSTTSGGNTDLKWTNIPATLTGNGARVVNVLMSATYIEGAVLDPVTVRASFPED